MPLNISPTQRTARFLIAALGSLGVTSGEAIAQITPDNTLGEGRSQVTPNVMIREEIGDLIEGGITQSSALFHSFESFNIDADQRVYFANPEGIRAIFSRVTGNDVSDIFGTLGVDGSANLFLANPNGIVFGEGAALDIRGSFFATTADAFVFEDGSQFSAVNPTLPPPLLSLDITPGLQYGPNPGPIDVERRVTLNAGRDLRLSAGSITSGGALTAEFGRLTLEAVTGNIELSGIGLGSAIAERDNGLVIADKDLTLSAANQVRVVGSILLSENEVLVEAGEVIDFRFSQVHSGRDMTFRAPIRRFGGPANGRTYHTTFNTYATGGYFITQEADGTVVDFIIPHENVILAAGDVQIDANYVGPSLYILAGGNVTLGDAVDTIEINRFNSNPITRNQIVRQIGDGNGGIQPVTIRSGFQAILDVRAGIDWNTIPAIAPNNTNTSDAIVTFGANGNPFNITDSTINFENANIQFTHRVPGIPFGIFNTESFAHLTNQYQANNRLDGDIRINSIQEMASVQLPVSIAVESSRAIFVNNIINVSPENVSSDNLLPFPFG
ncbi:MAG: filamentous hemagglutinin N-terminal domain-containing protein, partial [Merismopedia sp. SIO2A8]|nr:filamentous hemagglutinin N-terminal domain-containing protein [Merismopedia sp. SIO2A8]